MSRDEFVFILLGPERHAVSRSIDVTLPAWYPKTATAAAVAAAGFWYDPSQDIIYSQMNAWQRHVGYTWAYDVAIPAGSMIIDCEPIYFTGFGKHWMIELWKGQYGLETGAEIGVYYSMLQRMQEISEPSAIYPTTSRPEMRLYENPATSPDRFKFFHCGSPLDIRLFRLSFTLKKHGLKLFSRGPQNHWWLTGFKWGEFTRHTSHLSMDVTIGFPQLDGMPQALTHNMREEMDHMRHNFVHALKGLGYSPIEHGPCVSFQFNIPKTHQPSTRTSLEERMQANNELLVEKYLRLKAGLGLRNNDPNGFHLYDLQHAATPAVRDIMRNHSPPPMRHLGRKVTAHIPQHVMHDRGERHAEHDVFAFFHNKVWHNTHHPGSA